MTDLISLRMVVIAAGRPERELWRQGAGLASVPIEFFDSNITGAGDALARGGIDIVVVDSGMPDDKKVEIVKLARALQPPPFVLMAAPAGATRLEGTDGTVVRPAAVEDARKLVERCIRVKVATRVLIVDDSGTMRSIVRKILSASHFAMEIFEAEEGIAALEQLRTGNFDLVFLDYNMPGLNGFETLSEIKRENNNVAVVMMTSTVSNVMGDRAHAAGALAFLKKPFYPADIDAVLQRFYGLYAPIN
jgi:CheY-like chemotaxis protein